MESIEEFFKESVRQHDFNTLKIPFKEETLDNFIAPFMIYLRELQKWNKAYNLTSIDDEREIVIKHFIDSLLYTCFIEERNLTLADVGSGAGFPGIPIAIVRPSLKITLIEPSWKKCAFLKNIKSKLDLKNVEILQGRAEDLDEKFNIIVSRALWRIKDFVKKCSHLVKEGGFFIISKALKMEEEINEIPPNFKIEIKEFELPDPYDFAKKSKRFIIKINYAYFRN